MFYYEKPLNEPVLNYTEGSPEKAAVLASYQKLLDTSTHVHMDSFLDGMVEKKEELYCPHKLDTKIADVDFIGKEGTQAAIDHLLKNRAVWGDMDHEDRARIFLKAADLVAGPYRSLMNAATMLGQSKTVHQAEIEAACELADFLRFNVYYLTQILQEQPLSPDFIRNSVEYRGLEGFVFAIAPFNFTAISANLAAAPALMGCSVLWKPSLTASLSSYVFMQILYEAGLPEGVIQMVNGDPAAIGEVALSHPDLAGVHFTGSTGTFNKIWKGVADHLESYKNYPRIVGETGGKDFVLAHPTADENALITALIRGAYEYQGQKCSAASRAYIPRSLWERIEKPLVEKIQTISMGTPDDFSNFVCAVIDERAFDKIASYVEGAKKDPQSHILAGGEVSKEKGYFIQPTLIQCDNPKATTMVEEIFGPVLSLYVYEDQDWDKTIELVDQSTQYGLTGAIFARERTVLAETAKKLKYAAGNLYFNDKPTGAVVGQQPFGGARRSGTNDKAGSMMNLLRWTSPRTIKEVFVSPKDYRYPFMQPEKGN